MDLNLVFSVRLDGDLRDEGKVIGPCIGAQKLSGAFEDCPVGRAGDIVKQLKEA